MIVSSGERPRMPEGLRRRLFAACALLLALPLAGCIEIEFDLDFSKPGSELVTARFLVPMIFADQVPKLSQRLADAGYRVETRPSGEHIVVEGIKRVEKGAVWLPYPEKLVKEKALFEVTDLDLLLVRYFKLAAAYRFDEDLFGKEFAALQDNELLRSMTFPLTYRVHFPGSAIDTNSAEERDNVATWRFKVRPGESVRIAVSSYDVRWPALGALTAALSLLIVWALICKLGGNQVRSLDLQPGVPPLDAPAGPSSNRYCSECGRRLGASVRFCTSCGHRVASPDRVLASELEITPRFSATLRPEASVAAGRRVIAVVSSIALLVVVGGAIFILRREQPLPKSLVPQPTRVAPASAPTPLPARAPTPPASASTPENVAEGPRSPERWFSGVGDLPYEAAPPNSLVSTERYLNSGTFQRRDGLANLGGIAGTKPTRYFFWRGRLAGAELCGISRKTDELVALISRDVGAPSLDEDGRPTWYADRGLPNERNVVVISSDEGTCLSLRKTALYAHVLQDYERSVAARQRQDRRNVAATKAAESAGAQGPAASGPNGSASETPARLPEQARDENSPRRVGGEVTEPIEIARVKPQYPEAARKARMQGVCILEAVITKTGDVESVRVLRGINPLLDNAAIRAAQQWKYKPALFKGSPVPVYLTITVTFSLS